MKRKQHKKPKQSKDRPHPMLHGQLESLGKMEMPKIKSMKKGK